MAGGLVGSVQKEVAPKPAPPKPLYRATLPRRERLDVHVNDVGMVVIQQENGGDHANDCIVVSVEDMPTLIEMLDDALSDARAGWDSGRFKR